MPFQKWYVPIWCWIYLSIQINTCTYLRAQVWLIILLISHCYLKLTSSHQFWIHSQMIKWFCLSNQIKILEFQRRRWRNFRTHKLNNCCLAARMHWPNLYVRFLWGSAAVVHFQHFILTSIQFFISHTYTQHSEGNKKMCEQNVIASLCLLISVKFKWR